MKKKIVLIDDNLEMRENTAEILELASYEVVTANNGLEGVYMIEKELPDLIICDIMMPVMDGYEVLNALSKKENTLAIPFIFLSAKAEHYDQRKGMNLGADDYLIKPYDELELLKAVSSRLHKHEVLKINFTRDISGLHNFIDAVKGIDTLTMLTSKHSLKYVKKKEIIYKEGKDPKGVYFLNAGKVKITLTNNDGKELITAIYSAGDFFGYQALLEELDYFDSALVIEDAEICMIPKDDFLKLIYNSPEVSKKFIKMLSNELAEKEDKLLQLAYNSVRKRVAKVLITLHDMYAKENNVKYSVKISREDLSNLVGTSTETVIRTLSDFKDENLIDLKGGITIINYPKLISMKN